MNPWISAAIAVAAGLVIGSMAARMIRRLIDRPERPEAVRQIAPAMSSFVMGLSVAAGLIAAVGFVSPDQLRTIPRSLVAYLPKVLVAAVLLMVGNVAGGFAAVATRSAMVRATGQPRPGVARAVKVTILCAAVILAVSQLGVDTTIVNLAVAALLFSAGAVVTLLIGLGGIDVARNVAAGRYIRRIAPPGAEVDTGEVSGVVVAVHPATIELRQADGSVVHLPHSTVLSRQITVRGYSGVQSGSS